MLLYCTVTEKYYLNNLCPISRLYREFQWLSENISRGLLNETRKNMKKMYINGPTYVNTVLEKSSCVLRNIMAARQFHRCTIDAIFVIEKKKNSSRRSR